MHSLPLLVSNINKTIFNKEPNADIQYKSDKIFSPVHDFVVDSAEDNAAVYFNMLGIK